MSHSTAEYCPKCGTRTREENRYGRLRPTCPTCGNVIFFDPKVAVVAFIASDKAVLLIQRAGDPGKGLWALAGGYVEADEDPRDAVMRELLEETGLEIRVGQVLDVFYSGEGGAITIAYAADVVRGSLKPGDDAAAVAWFGKNELPELVFTSTITLIARWQTH